MSSGTNAATAPADQNRSARSLAESLRQGDLGATEEVFQLGAELVAVLPALADALQRTRGATRAKIASELGRLGSQFLAVIPRLRTALQNVVLTDGDEAVRPVAVDALAALGPMTISHVPGLIESLGSPVPAARAAAAQDLAQLGTEARDSIPSLISTCLNDPDLAVRVHAGVALWRVGRRLFPALPALIEGLQRGDAMTCWTAADCLGDMGADAAEAVP